MGGFIPPAVTTDFSRRNNGLQPSSERSPAIDLVHLARQTLDDQSLEGELLRLFDRQSAEGLQRLAGIADTDLTDCGDVAHKLRGSALAVGAWRVASAASDVENLCRNGASSRAGFRAALDGLGVALREARQAIADLLG